MQQTYPSLIYITEDKGSFIYRSSIDLREVVISFHYYKLFTSSTQILQVWVS